MLLARSGQRPGVPPLRPRSARRGRPHSYPAPHVLGPQGPDGCFASPKQWGEATFSTPSTAELLRAGDLGSEPVLPMA